jgi:sporulation protein YlmC with PRC-barrel domain
MAGAMDPRLTRASSIGQLRVQTLEGRLLGHLFDLHVRWQGTQAVVETLAVGRPGWLERLGWRAHEPHPVPWSAVVEVRDDGVIVVDDRRR